jgi:hypothetical protein
MTSSGGTINLTALRLGVSAWLVCGLEGEKRGGCGVGESQGLQG